MVPDARSSISQMVLPGLVGLGWALFNSLKSAILSTVPDKVARSGMTVTTALIGGAIGIAL
jgi:hypothetical protein